MEIYNKRQKRYGLVPRAYFKDYSHLDRTIKFTEPTTTFDKAMQAMAGRLVEREEPFNLYLYGNAGVGKTYWTQALSNLINAKQEKTLLYKNFPAVLSEIKATMGFKDSFANWKSQGRFMEMVEDVDILVIDDLGSEKRTEWSDELIYQIFDKRQREDMSNIIISNIKPDSLQYDARTNSRILNDCKEILYKSDIDRRRQKGERANF